MNVGYIYCINNKVNNKKYIGQTTKTIKWRYSVHINSIKYKIERPLYNDMLNYGILNFEINEIEKLEYNTKLELINKLNEKEIYWISKYKSNNLEFGYNLTSGGGGVKDLSEESRKKISEKNSGENNGMYGTTWSEEKKQQMKERMTGENNPQYGKHLSDETKQKLSKALTGRIITENTKQKISKTMKGVKKSEEMKKKLSEAKKGTKLTNDTKQKIKNTRLKGENNKMSKKVCQYNLDNGFVNIFNSMSDAARECNTFHSSISACCNGKKQTSGGYKWEYFYYKERNFLNDILL
jgi:group I intron endonuclease